MRGNINDYPQPKKNDDKKIILETLYGAKGHEITHRCLLFIKQYRLLILS